MPPKKWNMHRRPNKANPRESDQRKRQRTDDGNAPGGDASMSPQHHKHSAPRDSSTSSKRARSAVINLSNVKGHQAVVGTCDVRNDRQATAELVDLLNEFADDLYADGVNAAGKEEVSKAADAATVGDAGNRGAEGVEGGSGNDQSGTIDEDVTSTDVTSSEDKTDHTLRGESEGGGQPPRPTSAKGKQDPQQDKEPSLSMEEMIRQEADALRTGSDAKSHRFKSVNTSVKGVVMVCVMDPSIDILAIVDSIFARIRTTGKRRSRFLERVTPMQMTAYSELEAFKTAVKPTVLAGLPRVAEGLPPLAADPAKAKRKGNDSSTDTDKAASTAPEQSINASSAAAVAEPPAGEVADEPTDTNGVSTAENRINACSDSVDEGKKEATVSAAVPAPAPSQVNGAMDEPDGDQNEKTCDRRWRFRVDIRRRNSGLKRMDLINTVANAVGKGHAVSMSSPDVSFCHQGLFNLALRPDCASAVVRFVCLYSHLIALPL